MAKTFIAISSICYLLPFFIWFAIKVQRHRQNLPRNAYRRQIFIGFGACWAVAILFTVLAVIYI